MAEQSEKISNISEKEINDLLNMSLSDSVTTPAAEPEKPNVFKNSKVDESVLDNPLDTAKPEVIVEEVKVAEILSEVVNLEESEEEKSEKAPLLDALSDLVKSGKIILFDEGADKEGNPIVKDIKDYSKKELMELVEANQDRVREEESEKAPAEFFDQLSPLLQYAAKYEADGGKDLKGLFKHLAQIEEVKHIDVATETGQEQAVRQWLSLSEFGTPEEIENEISSYKDLNLLEKKAAQFKPKLEAKHQQLVEKELRDQETLKAKQDQAALKYRENIIKALQPGDLDGIKITPGIQNMLYTGLTQTTYPSVNGRTTNLFGHLIEKYSYVEPNPQLIAEALWLLKDRKAYHEAIGSKAVQGSTAETIKKLKTAGSEKATATNAESGNQSQTKTKTIPKKTPNIFARS